MLKAMRERSADQVSIALQWCAEIARGPHEDAQICRHCGEFYNLGDGLDESALCNTCAQEAVLILVQ